MEQTTVSRGAPLAGKVALITGGTRGIGAAIVRRLAHDGADVVFSYSTSSNRAERLVQEIEGSGRRALAVKADQAIASEVAMLVGRAHRAFGRLDILVNSAGVFVTGAVGDPAADLRAFDRQLEVNVKGVVAAVRAAVPLMADGVRASGMIAATNLERRSRISARSTRRMTARLVDACDHVHAELKQQFRRFFVRQRRWRRCRGSGLVIGLHLLQHRYAVRRDVGVDHLVVTGTQDHEVLRRVPLGVGLRRVVSRPARCLGADMTDLARRRSRRDESLRSAREGAAISRKAQT